MSVLEEATAAWVMLLPWQRLLVFTNDPHVVDSARCGVVISVGLDDVFGVALPMT